MTSTDPPEHLVPDSVTPPGSEDGDKPDEPAHESVSEPAKVMRVGSMIKQLLDEVHTTELDEASRERLRGIYRTSLTELGDAVSPDLREELDRLAPLFEDDEVPTEAELKIAHAQLVGWLEGLFHGIQATLFAQQMAARQQLEGMRSELPEGSPQPPGDQRPGTYL
jgi:Bacterial proteasome activator